MRSTLVIFTAIVLFSVSCNGVGHQRPLPAPLAAGAPVSPEARGQELLTLIRQHGDADQLSKYVGQVATFTGMAKPPGDSADLVLEGGVTLKVELTSPGDVRPRTVAWRARVTGMITEVRSSTVVVKVHPLDWRAIETF